MNPRTQNMSSFQCKAYFQATDREINDNKNIYLYQFRLSIVPTQKQISTHFSFTTA